MRPCWDEEKVVLFSSQKVTFIWTYLNYFCIAFNVQNWFKTHLYMKLDSWDWSQTWPHICCHCWSGLKVQMLGPTHRGFHLLVEGMARALHSDLASTVRLRAALLKGVVPVAETFSCLPRQFQQTSLVENHWFTAPRNPFSSSCSSFRLGEHFSDTVLATLGLAGSPAVWTRTRATKILHAVSVWV